MSDIVLKMEHVYKLFRKGEVFNSLRDLIPALTGKMFRREELSEADIEEIGSTPDELSAFRAEMNAGGW